MTLERWAKAKGLEAMYEQYRSECVEISMQCVAEGYPSWGDNYEIRVEQLKEHYPELFSFNRTEEVRELLRRIIAFIPMIYDEEVDDEFKANHFVMESNNDLILSANQNEIETLAKFFNQLYGEDVVSTGYFDPEEDEKNGTVDCYTGMYYLEIN